MRTLRLRFILFLLLAVLGRAEAADDFPISWFDGRDYVGLRELSRVYGFALEGPYGRAVSLSGKSCRMVFSTNGREVMINGVLVWLHEPLLPFRGHWYVRATDVRKVLDPIVRPARYLGNAGYQVIVLDPGHGGQDTGTKGSRNVEEKRVVLDLARRVRTQLVKAGYRVYLTRESDRFIALDDRPKKARAWGADLFVSIHLNSAAGAGPNGTETYALAAAGYASTSGGTVTPAQPGNRYDGPSDVLAYLLHRALCTRIVEGDRGLKRSRFMVLRYATCPSALVECAFLSNPREEERLLEDGFRDQVAQGIAKGIQDYLAAVKKARAEARP